MVKYGSKQLDGTFAALTEAARRAILEVLASGPASTSALAAPLNLSLPAIAKHLRTLEQVGLVTSTKSGRVRTYHLRAEPLRDASAWIERYRAFWEGQLDALEAYLERTHHEPTDTR